MRAEDLASSLEIQEQGLKRLYLQLPIISVLIGEGQAQHTQQAVTLEARQFCKDLFVPAILFSVTPGGASHLSLRHCVQSMGLKI